MDADRLTAARGVRGAVLAAVVASALSACGESGAVGPSAHGGKTSTTAPAARAVRVDANDLAAHVGDAVLIRGTAVTAAAGATVTFSDATPVYISGLKAWASVLEGHKVDVRGVLRRRASRVPSSGEQSHGLGETYALDHARWTLRGPRR